jgi:hypothetical protein
MVWSTDRKRFALALMLFLIWVGFLATLAVVSASRPADRRAVSTPALSFAAPAADQQQP